MRTVTTIHGDTLTLTPAMNGTRLMLRELDLDGIDLSGSQLTGCFFNESTMTGANLSNCDLRGSVFYRTNLSGADLRGSILDGCYFNEVIHSPSTRWPEHFDLSDADRRHDDGQTEVQWDSGSETYLCSPGWVHRSRIAASVGAATSIIPYGATGKVTPEVHNQLTARLALNMLLALSEGEVLEPDGWGDLFSLFDFETKYNFLGDEAEDINHTLCVMVLVALGTRFEQILPDGALRVTFRPLDHMEPLADGPFIRTLRLIFDAFCGEDHDLEADAPEFLALEPVTRFVPFFLRAKGQGLDVSLARADDARVSRVPAPVPGRPAEDALLETVIDMLYFTCFSRISDEELSEEPPDNDDDLGYLCSAAVLILGILGIEKASWETNGVITATLRPPMDIRAVLIEHGYLEEDDDPREESYGYTISPSVRHDVVAMPDLGLFGRLTA